MVWSYACGLDIIVRLFLLLFLHCELSHFSPSICRQWVPPVSATPLTILYRLFRNFACGLDIIVRSFLSLFPHCKRSHFSTSLYRQCVPLVRATPLTVLYRSFWNFAYVFFTVWVCACGLDITIKLFLSLFPHCELSYFSPFIYKQLVPLVAATPFTVLYRLLRNLACVFFMVWGCACGLYIIVRSFFFHYFPHCELSHFSPSIFRQWVTRKHNCSYNFILMFLKLCTWFSIVWRCACAFHIIIALIFVSFFYFLNFVIFLPQMYRQLVPCDCNFSYNFKRSSLNLNLFIFLPQILWNGTA